MRVLLGGCFSLMVMVYYGEKGSCCVDLSGSRVPFRVVGDNDGMGLITQRYDHFNGVLHVYSCVITFV